MKLNRSGVYALIVVAIVVAAVVILAMNANSTVKEPAVAGAFYPADKPTLTGMISDFMNRAKTPPVEGRLIALIAPHAGYQFSGQVAAFSYQHLKERKIDTVILIGPSHHVSFTGASVYASGSMRTPLGTIGINSRIAKSLIDEKTHVRSYPAAFDKEHSLEVQLPFLQATLGDFTIVPILIGQPTRESFSALAEKLTVVLRKNENAIIIASTDLSHFHDYSTAKAMDAKMTDAVARMSLEDHERLLSTGEAEMCGGYPVLLTMMIAQKLGATHSVLYQYANSGDVTNDRSRVVGYAAMGMYKSRLTEPERQELLTLAKRTIDTYVKQGKTPEYASKDARLLANGATFVTINKHHDLRGCIGNMQPVMPLYRSVISNAVAASSRDPRFPPLRTDELKDIQVEVTVLSPLEPIDDVKNIRIGTHGLYIVKGMNTGVLLPQVAEEYKWDVPTFLEQVSVKAGLPKDAWKDSQLYFFTADIIK